MFVDELDKYFADVGLYILTVGWIEPVYVSFPLAFWWSALPFIKIKSDDPKQAEALLSGGLVCQKTGIIFRVEEFKTTPPILQCFKCQSFGHKALNCTKKEKCVVCGEAHSHKNCPNKEKRKPKCANCRGPHVANYRGCPAYKDQAFRQHVVQKQISYASVLKQASPPPTSNTFSFTAEQIVSLVTNVVIQIAQPQLCTKICLRSKFRLNQIFRSR